MDLNSIFGYEYHVFNKSLRSIDNLLNVDKNLKTVLNGPKINHKTDQICFHLTEKWIF